MKTRYDENSFRLLYIIAKIALSKIYKLTAIFYNFFLRRYYRSINKHKLDTDINKSNIRLIIVVVIVSDEQQQSWMLRIV